MSATSRPDGFTPLNIVLRPPTAADEAVLIASVQSSLAELTPWLPWATEAYGSASALGWINGEFGDVHRFVIMSESGEHLGNIALNDVDAAHRRANLGYWVRSDCASRGVATEALRRMPKFAFEETNLQRLEILACVDNEASRRVAEKAGAHYEGVAKKRITLHGRQHDAHQFSFTR